jgi:hypothetical protein
MSNQKIHGRKQRARDRRKHIAVLAAQGKPDKKIAEELGMAEQTVRNNLVIARKEHPTVTDENRQATLEELRELKDEVRSHRKGDKPLPLAAVDRLIKIAEVVMRLEGTAAPSRSENVSINADVENLGPYRKFVLAVQGLDETQVEELLTAARAVPRKALARPVWPKTSPLWGNEPKQLEGDTDATS